MSDHFGILAVNWLRIFVKTFSLYLLLFFVVLTF